MSGLILDPIEPPHLTERGSTTLSLKVMSLRFGKIVETLGAEDLGLKSLIYTKVLRTEISLSYPTGSGQSLPGEVGPVSQAPV